MHENVSEELRRKVIYRLYSGQTVEDAEDACQEALIRYYHHPPDIAEEEDLAAWLVTVGRHVLLDQHRRQQIIQCTALQENTPLRGNDATEQVAQKVDIEKALQSLNADERTLLLLRAASLTFGEIAAQMNLTEDAVKKRWKRALPHFRALFAPG